MKATRQVCVTSCKCSGIKYPSQVKQHLAYKLTRNFVTVLTASLCNLAHASWLLQNWAANSPGWALLLELVALSMPFQWQMFTAGQGQ
jgi:hypothetical protein